MSLVEREDGHQVLAPDVMQLLRRGSAAHHVNCQPALAYTGDGVSFAPGTYLAALRDKSDMYLGPPSIDIARFTSPF